MIQLERSSSGYKILKACGEKISNGEVAGQERRQKPRMSSRKKNKAALYEKLRAATNSNAMNKTSIIVDASKYIGELKNKVDRLNQEIGTSSTPRNSLPAVTVENLEKGFLINVFSGKNCPGLLVSILEAFEELGLDVLDARVSCEDNFQLEAIGGDQNQGHDAQVVKQAVLQAIHHWNEGI